MAGNSSRGLERSLQALVIGTHRAAKSREELLGWLRMQEMHQVIQIEVSGTAADDQAPATTDIDVRFIYPFVYAPGQSDLQLTVPMFTFGVELTKVTGHIITPQVIGWDKTNKQTVKGATLRIRVVNSAEDVEAFAGVIHVMFTGLVLPNEDDGDG